MFKHVIEMYEDTATNMCCQSLLLDQASQMCGISKVNILRDTSLQMNRKFYNGGCKCVNYYCDMLGSALK